MDAVRTRPILGVTAAALALGLLVAGCGKDDSSSSSSSSASSSSAASSSATSSAAASTTSAESSAPEGTPDYESLLVKPADLPAIGSGPWVGDAPKVTLTPEPPDVSQTYTSGTNAINATVMVADDAAGAATALGGAAGNVPSQVTGTPTPLPAVSPDATFTSGTSPDGKAAMAALLFTVDNTVAIIVFGSAPGDLEPVPADFAEAVGKAQVAAIQAGLPNLG